MGLPEIDVGLLGGGKHTQRLFPPSGSPSTGNIWSVGAQLIGSNIYSTSDTQLFNASILRGPTGPSPASAGSTIVGRGKVIMPSASVRSR